MCVEELYGNIDFTYAGGVTVYRNAGRERNGGLWMQEKENVREKEQETLEEQVVRLLSEREFTVTTAESCTGGWIAGALINVAGASDVLNEGYVTYSNEAKQRLLGVREDTLRQFGAVSEQTAAEMAAGAARAAHADVALSSTGIAGPGGGTPEKPVGLVYIGCFVRGEVQVRECRFTGNRAENRRHSVEAVLRLAAEMLSLIHI